MNTRKINLLPVLQQVSEETNVLVERNGTACRVPAGAFGGDLIEKLAPTFTKTAPVVTCNPVEGYPVEVVSHISMQAISVPLTGWTIDEISSDPVYRINDLRPGKYAIYCEIYDPDGEPTELKVELPTATVYVKSGETKTFTHDGGILLLANFNFGTMHRIELTCVADTADGFTSVKLLHNGIEHTATFGRAVGSGSFNWSTGVLSIPVGNPNLIPVDLADASNWGECDGIPCYALSLPDGTYTLSAKTDGDGISVYYDGVDVRERITTLVCCGSVATATFTIDHSIHPNGTIYLFDDNYAPNYEFVKLEIGEEATSNEVNTIQLTPHEIIGLPGVNTLQSNTGDTQVSGKLDPDFAINDLYRKLYALIGG